jgi:hypothetical protein
MAKRPHYTSNELIEAVKRKISMPITQVTFSNDEILNFANEELFLAQVPSIMQYHEEYLVYRHNVPLVSQIQKYDIPDRAIGMKLRDLFFKDDNGNLYEMTNTGASNQDYFQQNSFGVNIPRYFFVENNSIVLSTDVTNSAPGSLEMIYYLRPNSLVENERAAICINFTKIITINSASLSEDAGDTFNFDSITTRKLAGPRKLSKNVKLHNLGKPSLVDFDQFGAKAIISTAVQYESALNEYADALLAIDYDESDDLELDEFSGGAIAGYTIPLGAGPARKKNFYKQMAKPFGGSYLKDPTKIKPKP